MDTTDLPNSGRKIRLTSLSARWLSFKLSAETLAQVRPLSTVFQRKIILIFWLFGFRG